MTKKRILTLTLLFFCSFMIVLPSSTFADFDDNWINPYDAIFNWNDVTKNVSGEKPLFAKYPIVNYTLDFDVASSAVTGGTNVSINLILWIILSMMGGACLLVISLSDWAFNQNFFAKNVVDQVDVFVDELIDKLFFGELFTLAVFFLGISLIFTLGRNEDVAGKLLKVILNLVIAFTLLSNMGLIIKSMYGLGEWGSKAVFTAFGEIPGFKAKSYTSDKGRNAQLNVYDGFFKYNFYKPWQLANFGLYTRENKSEWSKAEKQVDDDSKQVLEAGLVSGGRLWWEIEKAGKNIVNAAKSLVNGILPGDLFDEDTGGYGYITMTVAGIPFRFLIIALTFVIGSLYGCFLLAIAGTTIFMQFFLILLALLAPLVFLLVLLPDYGDQVLLKWLQTVIGAAMYWILASLLFCMVLFLQHIGYQVADNWFVAMFLQLIIVFTFFRFRKDVAEFLPAIQMAAYAGAEQAFFEKSKELVDKTRDLAIEGGTTAVLGAASIYTGANLMGMTKSRSGNMVRGVVDGAIKARKEAKEKGEKQPGLARSITRAVRGKLQPDAQQADSQRGSVVDPQQQKQMMGADAGDVRGVQSPALRELEAAALKAAAALQQLTPNQFNAESRLEQQNTHREFKDKQGRSVRVEENGQVFAYEGDKKNYLGNLQADGKEIRHQLLGQTGQINKDQLTITDQAARNIGLSGPIIAQAQTTPAATISPQILQNIQQTALQRPVQVAGTDGQRIVTQPAAQPGEGIRVINNYYTTNHYTQASGSGGGTHTIERHFKETKTETHKQINPMPNTGTSMPQPPPTNVSGQQQIDIKVDVGTSGVSVGGSSSGQPIVIQGGESKITQEFKAGTQNIQYHQHDHLNYQDNSTVTEENKSGSVRSNVDLSGFATGNPYELAKTIEKMAKTAEKGEHEMNRLERLVNRMKKILGKKE